MAFFFLISSNFSDGKFSFPIELKHECGCIFRVMFEGRHKWPSITRDRIWLFSVGNHTDVKKDEHHKVKMAFHVKSGKNLPLLKLLVINLPAALYCSNVAQWRYVSSSNLFLFKIFLIVYKLHYLILHGNLTKMVLLQNVANFPRRLQPPKTEKALNIIHIFQNT